MSVDDPQRTQTVPRARRMQKPPQKIRGSFRFAPMISGRRTWGEGERTKPYFFILRAAPSNVVTIACINPSAVCRCQRRDFLYGSAKKGAVATHWVANVFSIVVLCSDREINPVQAAVFRLLAESDKQIADCRAPSQLLRWAD